MSIPVYEAAWSQRRIGDIAATLPGASALFRRLMLDFCCHGDLYLDEAAAQRSLDIRELQKALTQLAEENRQPTAPDEPSALIDHILARYHETHRRELPELLALARKVETVHAAHPQAPLGLADLLMQMTGELEVHMKKEELILFPGMRNHPAGKFTAPITQMRSDHEDHGTHLKQLERRTNHHTPPDDACRSWRALYAGTAKLVDDLMEHIHLENNVLFPRFLPEAEN